MLSMLLVSLCVSDVNAQNGCTGNLAVTSYGCTGSAVVANCGSSGSSVASYGILRKITARTTRPVINTLAYISHNRPRPFANYVQVAAAPVVSVRSANCGCTNCNCVDCNCGAEATTVNYVQAVRVQAVPVLRTRDVVYNCDTCGQATVAPVATAVRNVLSLVPRTIQNARAVRQANLVTSNLFFIPVEQSEVETAPSPTPESDINDSVSSLDPADLMLASI